MTTAETSNQATTLRCGKLTINTRRYEIETTSGALLQLPRLEFALLLTLTRNSDRLLSLDDLAKTVWGEQYMGDNRAIYTCICRLRKKLRAIPGAPHIATVVGCGYRLDPGSSNRTN
jgi:DNA-binding response OmpR family regulator